MRQVLPIIGIKKSPLILVGKKSLRFFETYPDLPGLFAEDTFVFPVGFVGQRHILEAAEVVLGTTYPHRCITDADAKTSLVSVGGGLLKGEEKIDKRLWRLWRRDFLLFLVNVFFVL